MNIAIDSSSSLCYTGVLSCSLGDLTYFYEKLEEILAERNVYPPFHWRNLTNNTRESFVIEYRSKDDEEEKWSAESNITNSERADLVIENKLKPALEFIKQKVK